MKNEFLKLVEIANKMVIPNFYQNERYYIFKDKYQGKSCIVLYSHKAGNRFNCFGSSWFYYHDAKTGDFITSFNGGVKAPDNKKRLLKADLLQLQTAYSARHKKKHATSRVNFVKITVKSSYVDLRLFTKENETFKVLQLIREIHDFTKAGFNDYSPYRGHYQRPPNNLQVTMRRVAIDSKKARSRFIGAKLNEICIRSIDILNAKLLQYSKAA